MKPGIDGIGPGPAPLPPDAGDPRARQAMRRASQDFEALFLATLLRSMRATTDAFAPDGERAPGGDVLREVMDEHVAVALARRGGIGLASMLEEQLERRTAPQPTQEEKP